MWLPIHDPFVIFGIALLGCTITIAILLLTVVQRGSAEEVWQSVESRSKPESIAAASATEINHLDIPPRLDQGHQDSTVASSSKNKKDRSSKAVRFSSVNHNNSPQPPDHSGRRSSSLDLESASSQRMSWNQQQVLELHFV